MDDRMQLLDYILRKVALAQAELARAWITAVGTRRPELGKEIEAIDRRLERLRGQIEEMLEQETQACGSPVSTPGPS